jgi:hypothetical protein
MPMSDDRDDVLLLDVPASGDYLSVLPTATAAVATRLGFSLDEIEDLRAAVNAAASLLQPPPPSGPLRLRKPVRGSLHCRLDVNASDLVISVSRTGGAALPDDGNYQWQVLRALTDGMEVDRDGTAATIRIRQARPSTEADAETQAHRID